MVCDKIETLERQRKHFMNTTVISPKAFASFNKVIDLFEESQATQARLKVATRSRHRAAKNLLSIILLTLDHEVFMLCTFSLSTTYLASIKDTANFVGSLRAWWAGVEVPVGLSSVTEQLLARCGKALPRQAIYEQTTGRYAIEASPDLGATCRDNEDRNLAANGEPSRESSDDYSDSREDKEPPPQPQDVSFAGEAYKLEPMDAIRVLATNAGDVRLTIPHYQGVRPFITIQCSEKTAFRLTTREKIM